ncbi:hypothetical protein TraAM80_01004 [Trypanosoma rangeli]|uniref:Leucine-rich repeat protein (LRRP) n=1 Tax=Trypanosoma rangeli TaxID=5698 RepID=A0A3R7LC24_TRYRA|nr:uncharacterized protein TraAM80_01004 [Trypanosoma rangeli]RNF11387.1 hypothetical protein TraAM80_01004 [Trypanosoma rangeli]|eukprot:RNF11387.1 hypothetical protein TraAM80_01004 [Trypanosoma rangeli]
MNIDLSFKSISELRFDQARASEEEVLVASRVQSLNACNNRIKRIIGLGTLFNNLAHLDLAYNDLGSRAGPDLCSWLDAMPFSLRVLNLAHNALSVFMPTETMEGGVKNRGEGNGSAASVAATPAVAVSGRMEKALERLRRACPITLALFFSRKRFPYLRELDLSYNALSLTLDESDRVEAMWQEAVEGPAVAHAFNQEGNTAWLHQTTSAVAVLQLDGNTHLTALNGVLCGMEALTHLQAANCGVSDLTAVSAAATFCPRLERLDMHGSPVADAFINAPRTTISTFIELLLQPWILSDVGAVDLQDETKENELEKRATLQRIVREVAQQRVEQIETILLRQQRSRCSTLSQVLYAALLQQIIPQVVELDGDIDVNAAREGLMNAMREVLEQVVEDIDKSITPVGSTKASLSGVSSQNRASQERHRERSQVKQPKLVNSHGGTDRSRDLLETQLRSTSSVARKGRETIPASDGVTSTVSKSERSRSAKGMMMRAAAAAAQLRPAVVVTGSSTPTTSNNTTTASSKIFAPSSAFDNIVADAENRINVSFSREFECTTATTNSIDASNSSNNGVCGIQSPARKDKSKFSYDWRKEDISHVCDSADTTNTTVSAPAAARTHSDSSSFCEENGGKSRFQRAVAALTPMLLHRLRSEGLPDHRAVTTNLACSSKDERDTSALSTLTSNSSILTMRETLLQQARALETALLASQNRQRGMQEDVSRLKEQLQQDRRLIIDQRKEATCLRQELNLLVESNRRVARRVKKRQKEIAYGAAALRRREAVSQRKAALEYIEREEKSLQQAERQLREKLSLSGAWTHTHLTDSTGLVQVTPTNGMETIPPRKTRANLLRENAVKERMTAMREQDTLSYSPRRFRPSEYCLNGGDKSSNRSMTDTSVHAQTERHQSLRETRRYGRTMERDRSHSQGGAGERIHGKTPWRKYRSSSSSSHTTTSTGKTERKEAEQHSMYDKGFSPYSDVEKSEGVPDNRGNKCHSKSLEGLSLQQLFEEAAAIQHRQRMLHQCMSGVANAVRNEAVIRETGTGERDVTSHDDAPHGGDDVEVTFGRYTPSTCIGVVQETGNGGATSHVAVNDLSWRAAHGESQTNEPKMETSNCNDDDDSVDVVVSLAESQFNADLIVATVPPPLPSSDAPVKNENVTEEPRWHTGAPQQQYKGEDECLAPLLRTAEGHFSMDARRIYTEILRQSQEQYEQRIREAAHPEQQRKQTDVDGVKLGGKEEVEGEELSTVSTEPKGSSITENENTEHDGGATKEAYSCYAHLNEDDRHARTTRRALFFLTFESYIYIYIYIYMRVCDLAWEQQGE